MHTSPTSLTCALTIIREADLNELVIIKEYVTTSLLTDITNNPRREETGDSVLDEVRGWVDEARIKKLTEDRRLMLQKIVARQQRGSKPIAGGITEDMIERAREYPIEQLIDTKIFKGTGKWIACAHCPLPSHGGERTPSFFIDKANKWRCFGCTSHGDSIELYMKMNKVNFIKAVKALSI